jgi:uncharacterized LabA/DUF88 family protein
MNRKIPKTPITYAFIDSQNLNLGVLYDIKKRDKTIYKGQKLDFKKFRDYIRVKYGVKEAYIFIGNIPKNQDLYLYLQNCGYKLVMKDAAKYWDKKTKQYEYKGNVDTDIVLYSVGKFYKDYTDAVFVSGDGDFVSTYDYLAEKGKLKAIIVPNRYNYSRLLNKYHDILQFVTNNKTLFRESKRPGVAVGIKTLGVPGHGDESIVANRARKVNRKMLMDRKQVKRSPDENTNS